MKLIDNRINTLKEDLSGEIKKGSKMSIAAACFSIYAFQSLKEQLTQIDELRFIFTSPAFIAEKAKKEKREFYIPRLAREKSLYGTEFEIKLRNELTQKAIAKECADWIRAKAVFMSKTLWYSVVLQGRRQPNRKKKSLGRRTSKMAQGPKALGRPNRNRNK